MIRATARRWSPPTSRSSPVPEQSIDHDIDVAESRRESRRRDRRSPEALVTTCGIALDGAGVADHPHIDLQSGRGAQPRDDESVAAVVTGAAHNADAADVGPARAQGRKGRFAGALHEIEPGYRERADRRGIYRAHRRGVVQIGG